MFGPEFVSCWLKVGRASELLDALKSEILAWKNTDPYRGSRKSNSDGTRHSIVLEIKNKPPLDRWALITGDCVHNLRSALDHFVYAIAVRESGSNPPPNERELQFPIADSFAQFQGRPLKRIASLSSRVRTEIELIQPYNRAHANLPPLLGLLRDFDDADKHRLLNVVTSSHAQGKFSFESVDPELPVIPTGVGYHEWPVENGTEIAWFTIDPPNPNVRYKHESFIVISIAHSKGPSGRSVTEVIAVLEWIIEEVKLVIDRIGAAV